MCKFIPRIKGAVTYCRNVCMKLDVIRVNTVSFCSLALQWCLGDNGKLYGKLIRLTPSGSCDRTLDLTTELIQVQRNRVINVKTRLSMRIYDTLL